MVPMVVKEFHEVRRDRRTLVMMVALPVLLLVMFGYAASFDVDHVDTAVVGPGASEIAALLPERLDVVLVDPEAGAGDAEGLLQRGEAVAVVVADPAAPALFVDGADLFSARAVVAAAGQVPALGEPVVLFNPELETPPVMIPAIIGMILVFVGIVITSLGIVREREAGTLDQLAVMPLRAGDVIAGKLAPYFLVAVVDLVVVTVVAVTLFDVPFRGSVILLAAGGLLFLFVTLGIGILISIASQTAGQAIQLALMVLLPQVLLSGMVFPLDAMAPAVAWIGKVLPLTWFIRIARPVMLKDAPFSSLLVPFAVLAVEAVVVFGVALARFHRELAPRRSGRGEVPAAEVTA